MQSGKANTRHWVLEFEPASARRPDPLMGWTVTADMSGEVRMFFDTREEAVAWADRYGIAFEVLPESKSDMKIRSYADNFAYSRKIPWTH